MTELLATRAWFRSTGTVDVEIRASTSPGVLTLWHLGREVARRDVAGDQVVGFGPLAPGGYGVELRTRAGLCRTALQVTDHPRAHLRYGFVADYSPGRDVSLVRDAVRRLHLTGMQLYDWAYRHADLVGGGERYEDALGQPVSLETVRRIVRMLHEVGALALGYAAVYGVGADEWGRWQHLALLTPGGAQYMLGDFLSLVDCAAPEWLSHLTADLAAAAATVGLDGFHLDQYGYPKRAVRPDGTPVDVAASFATLIRGVRARLPQAYLVFNNVNDFPTATTARAPQDATYIEVWPPQVTLGSLAATVLRARAVAPTRPVVVAAYQQVYSTASADEADRAASLTMATLASHGASQLLVGEADRVLVDPYYVRSHQAGASTADMLRRWFDFLVEHHELLFDHAAQDVTASWVGEYNDDLDVSYMGHDVGEQPLPGTIWRRVVTVGRRLVVHLINLCGQSDQLWDAPRRPPEDVGSGRLRARRVGDVLPRVRWADPDRSARLLDVAVAIDGDHAVADIPAPHLWQVVVVDLDADAR